MDVKNNNLWLMQGDCLERMKEIDDESVNLILTDPPYGMGFQSNYRKKVYNKICGDTDIGWIREFCFQASRVMANNSAAYIFCSFHNIEKFKYEIQKVLKVKNILVWEKNNTSMGDLRGDFSPKVEFVIFSVKGRPLIRGKRDANIFKFSRTGNDLHPTQKPVDMCEYLIEKFSDEGDIVLDPFMGSGTTGVACVNTNRNFIGIERDEGYFKIAQERIERAKKEKECELL